MRASLRWALIVTMVLTAAALLWPSSRPAAPVAAVPRAGAASPDASGQSRAVRTASRAAADEPTGPRPAELPPWRIEPARGDPFALPASPERPRAAAAPKVAQATAAPPPPLPVPKLPAAVPGGTPAQAARIRVLGTMRTPTGERLVVLANGDAAVTAKVGQALDGGYTVEAVEARAVHLSHAATDTKLVLTVPAPPNEP